MRPHKHRKIFVHRVDEADRLVLIESADIDADGMKKGRGIVGGAKNNGSARSYENRGRDIGLRNRRAVQAGVAHITNYPHDLIGLIHVWREKQCPWYS